MSKITQTTITALSIGAVLTLFVVGIQTFTPSKTHHNGKSIGMIKNHTHAASDYITTATEKATQGSINTKKTTKLPQSKGEPILTLKDFAFDLTEGSIGNESKELGDDSSDNVFRFFLSKTPSSNQIFELSFDLYGVSGQAGVQAVLNNTELLGGKMVKTNTEWTHQKIYIQGSDLILGENTLLFTSHPDQNYFYKIKKLSILPQVNPLDQVTLDLVKHQDKIYLKGSSPLAVKTLLINGEKKPIEGLNFESVFTSAPENTLQIEFKNGKIETYSLDTSHFLQADFLNETQVEWQTQPFYAEDVNTLRYKGLTLQVPPFALQKTTTFKVRTLAASELPPLDMGMVNVTDKVSGYRLLPHGTEFKDPATLSLSYDLDKLPEGYTAEDIRTFYYDLKGKRWIALQKDSLLLQDKQIVSLTPHFTDFINGILKTPESPETSTYTPTSITDIKAAQPLLGIQNVSTPQANQDGSLSTGFSLNIPAGRMGMQPSLALQYSSEGGNGWLGMNWNLSLSSVSIDTRWGAPRYLPTEESETYTIDGAMLTPTSHKAASYETRSSDKQFYPRIEGSFNKIIRKGDNPTNYYWVVTDKGGSKHYYGGNENGVVENAVMRDDLGNIGYWSLTKEQDLHGNYVSYEYEKDLSGGFGQDNGQQLYIKTIRYTGHNGEEGKYSVHFETQAGRPDVQINARLGFKQVTDKLLHKIEVKYQENPIRSYQLDYTLGTFNKSMLEKITELDSQGNEFYSNSFDYFDDIKQPDGYYKMFDELTEWEVSNNNDDVIGSPFLGINAFESHYSNISGSKSNGFSANFRIGVGFSTNCLQFKNNTVGIHGGYSYSKGETMINLQDLNGDNLPDKVFKQGNEIYYRPNLSSLGVNGFGVKTPISTLSMLGETKSSSTSVGADAQFSIAGAGFDLQWQKSETKKYFMDINGDGLTDFVDNGTVKFNHLVNGVPIFNGNSGDTPSPILSGGEINSDLFTPPSQSFIDSLNASFPLHDIVRVWRAPRAGTIAVNQSMQLLEDTSAERAAYTTNTGLDRADGVIAYFQHQNDLIWSEDFTSNDYSPRLRNNSLDVTKGDLVFFRLSSRYDGNYDQMLWNPDITYTSDNIPASDANGLNLTHYNASDDFILSHKSAVIVAANTPFTAQLTLDKSITSDFVKLRFVKWNATLADFEDITSPQILDDTQDVQDYNFTYNGSFTNDEQVKFLIESDTEIDWQALKIETSELASPNDTLKIPFQLSLHSEFVNQNYLVQTDTIACRYATITFDPIQNLNLHTQAKGEFTVSIKQNQKLIAKTRYKIDANTITVLNSYHQNDSIYANEPLYYEITLNKYNDRLINEGPIPHDTFQDLAKNVTCKFFNYEDSLLVTKNLTLETYHFPFNSNLGLMYRNWGAFAVNGDIVAGQGNTISLFEIEHANDTGNYTDIDEDEIDSDDDFDIDPNDESIPLTNAPLYFYRVASTFVPNWQAVDLFSYIHRDTVSASRLGEDDLLQYYEMPVMGSGARAFNLISKTNSMSVNGSVSGGIIGAGASHSIYSDNYSTLAMSDINGDRYPDFISDNKVQSTNQVGGISPLVYNLNSNTSNFVKADAWGISNTGSYSHGEPSGDRFIIQTSKAEKKKTSNTTAEESNKESDKNPNCISLEGSIDINNDKTLYTYRDINGDGLVDRIYEGGGVGLNKGYGFLNEENWGYNDISTGHSEGFGAGLGYSIKHGSFSFGYNFTRTENETQKDLLDINSDGLPDKVSYDYGDIVVDFNNGNGFAAPNNASLNNIYTGSANKSVSVAKGGSANVSVCIPLVVIRIVITAGGGYSHSINRSLNTFMDINGDGYVDYVESDNQDQLKVRLNRMGKTYLMKSIHTATGAEVSVDYQQIKSSYDSPNAKWVLSEVTVNDGHPGDGVDITKNTFSYENPYYHRHERKDLGFEKVTTHQIDTQNQDAVYRSMVQEYYNRDIYRAGMPKHSYTMDAAGNFYAESLPLYQYRNALDQTEVTLGDLSDFWYAQPVFIQKTQETNNFYEGQSSVQLAHVVNYEYDHLGNVTKYTDYGNGQADDLVTAEMSYHQYPTPYIMGAVSEMKVTTAQGLTRHKTSNIDPNTGDVLSLKQYLNATDFAEINIEYDAFGNMKKFINPENYKGQRYFKEYQYDPEVHQFPVHVTNAFGYTSTATFDYRYQTPVSSIDTNEDEMRFTLDEKGRPSTITGPYEIESGKPYTIKFEYHPEAATPYATTYHYHPDYPTEDIKTYTFTDALGRALQVKKTIALYSGTGTSETSMLGVSGKTEYDAFGRVTKSYYPITEPLSNATTFNPNQDTQPPTQVVYDVLDRQMQTTLPDGSVSTMTYSIADYNGLPTQHVTQTDPLGLVTASYTDVTGRTLATEKISTTDGSQYTRYEYNPLGELLKVTDVEGHETINTYDAFGRRTQVIHPDAGKVELSYDMASNILTRTTPVTRAMGNGAAIKYDYDYQRLEQVLYPQNIANNVHYYFGAPDALKGRRGRLWLQKDASGGREFYYGKMGVVTKEIRTIMVNEANILTYVSSSEYDTWNRIKQMAYPDGEIVHYEYNKAGNVRKMWGEKQGNNYAYIDYIGYDAFEQRTYLKHGNGVESRYTFDPLMHRLQQLKVDTPHRNIISNTYTYDAVSNILSVSNTATAQVSQDLGGSSTQNFEYDGFYRLKKAGGSFQGFQRNAAFTLEMEYNAMNSITHKKLHHTLDGAMPANTNYHLAYDYTQAEGTPAHAVKRLVQSPYQDPATLSEITEMKYDANGNLTEQTQGLHYKLMNWDEENRLQSVNNDGNVSLYTYDASGERVIKSNGNNQNLFIDGAPVAVLAHNDNYTTYVGSFMTAQKERFTKHYYIGSQRVVSKIGSGQFSSQFDHGQSLTAGNINFSEAIAQNTQTINNYLASLGIPPGPAAAQGAYAPLPIPQTPEGNMSNDQPPLGWPQNPAFNPPGGVPGPPVQFGTPTTNANVQPGYGYTGTGALIENDIFYFHSDHLGSTSYLTNKQGNVSQHVEYIPFGETLIESHLNNQNNPYLYNGKELDAETGFYYYGARYYEPKSSLWLSVDPLAEKFLNFSPYAYTFNNPINFVDPDGMSADPVYDEKLQKIGDDGKNEGKIHIVWGVAVKNHLTKDANGNINNLGTDGVITLEGGSKTIESIEKSVKAMSVDTVNRELGGHTQKDENANVQTVNWDPGPEKNANNPRASINTFTVGGNVNIPSDDVLLDYWHLHTDIDITKTDKEGNEIISVVQPGPSPGDFSFDVKMRTEHKHKGATIQVDTKGYSIKNGAAMINFYDGNLKLPFSVNLKNLSKIK